MTTHIKNKKLEIEVSEKVKPANDNDAQSGAACPSKLDAEKLAFLKPFDVYRTRRSQATAALCQALSLAQKLALEMLKDQSKHEKVVAHLLDIGIRVTKATTVGHAALKALAPMEMHQKEGRCAEEYCGDRKRLSNWAAAIQAANDQGVKSDEFVQWIEKVGGLERAKGFRKSETPKIKVPRANETRDYLYRKPKFNDQTVEIPLHRFGFYAGDFMVTICRKVSGNKFEVIAALKDAEIVNRAAKSVYKQDVEKALENRQATQNVTKNADNDNDEDEAA